MVTLLNSNIGYVTVNEAKKVFVDVSFISNTRELTQHSRLVDSTVYVILENATALGERRHILHKWFCIVEIHCWLHLQTVCYICIA